MVPMRKIVADEGNVPRATGPMTMMMTSARVSLVPK